MKKTVSAEWLYQNLNTKNLVILDASLHSTAEGLFSDNKTTTIKGARYLNLKKNFSNPNSPFPNTVPSAKQFELECQKLGIHRDSKIVVFDNLGVYSSPRIWWLFTIMGHDDISVLNGGLPEWTNKRFPLVNKNPENYTQGDFKATFQEKFVKSYQDVLENLSTESFSLIDARSEGRFNGLEKEPRKHLKSGHIPKSVNIPYVEVLENGMFKSEQELKKIFEKKCSKKNDLVFSCGSGLTACIVMMACEIGYKKSPYIYDGSWSEWAELQNLKNACKAN